MLGHFLTLAVSLALCYSDPPATIATTDDAAQPIQIVVSSPDGSEQHVAAAIAVGGTGQAVAVSPHVVRVAATAQSGADYPRVWIGVRISPIPAPLAAHVGDKGAMIANIVKESPADRAGLEQYDIVTEVNGETIAGPDELTDALRERKAGDQVRLTVIRKSKPEPMQIALETRPDGEIEYKYEEAEMALFGDAIRMRGKALQIGPDGRYSLQDLGTLDEEMKVLVERLRSQGFGAGGVGGGFQWTPNMPDDAKLQVKLRVERDGATTTIETLEDGRIKVGKTDADGMGAEHIYDDAAALEAGDPEAFALYNESARGGSQNRIFIMSPDGQHLDKEFRVEIRRKVEAAMERANEAMQLADERMKEAMRRAEEEVAKAHGAMTRSTSESFAVNQKSDGSLTVSVIRDGKRVGDYSFDSVESFKEAEPELYERVKDFIQ